MKRFPKKTFVNPKNPLDFGTQSFKQTLRVTKHLLEKGFQN
jgi:hypothetical protein